MGAGVDLWIDRRSCAAIGRGPGVWSASDDVDRQWSRRGRKACDREGGEALSMVMDRQNRVIGYRLGKAAYGAGGGGVLFGLGWVFVVFGRCV